MKKIVALIGYGFVLFFVLSATIGIVWALMINLALLFALLVGGYFAFINEPGEDERVNQSRYK